MEVAEKKKLKVPKLRFSDFEEDLKSRPLGEVALWKSGGTPSKAVPEYWEGDLPWISASEMRGKFYSDSKYRISKEGLRKGSKLATKGTLLLLTRGSMLFNKIPVGITTIDVSFNQDIKSLKPTNELDLEYAYQWFCFKEHRLMNLVGGTGIGAGKLDTADLKKINLNLPTLPEQKKIADFLGAVDARIQQLNRKKELLETYKKGVMQKLFSQELRFKQADGTSYADWEEKRLGEIGKTYNGLTGKTKEDFGEGAPYVNYKQIFDSSKIDPAKFDHVDIQPNEKQSRVNYGDVFFTTSSETRLEVGFASVLLDKVEELYLNSFCFGYRINSFDQFLPEYARYLFRSEGFRKDITRLGQGSTRYNMSKNEMKKLSVLLPSKEEQQKIADFLSSLDKKIAGVNTQIEKTQQFKKGLLQQMFV